MDRGLAGMKAHFRSKNGRLVVEVEGATIKDLFVQLANIQDIFEAEEECGLCGSNSIRMVTRENDGNKYHELRCLDCGAQFSFGQRKQGGDLFPRRKDKDGNWLSDRGWSKYSKAKEFTLESPRSAKSEREVFTAARVAIALSRMRSDVTE
jgi:hypothetical protein